MIPVVLGSAMAICARDSRSGILMSRNDNGSLSTGDMKLLRGSDPTGITLHPQLLDPLLFSKQSDGGG